MERTVKSCNIDVVSTIKKNILYCNICYSLTSSTFVVFISALFVD